jgi:hypothetical protein
LGSAEGGSTAPILLTSVVAGNLRALPAFNERDGLADRIATRGQAMGGALTSLTGVEERETDLRADLRRLIDAQRVAIVATYGRLLGILPKRFVETLFPHPRSKHGTGPVRRRRWASPPAPVADGPGRASADRRRPAPHPIPALPARRSAGARMRSAPPRRRSPAPPGRARARLRIHTPHTDRASLDFTPELTKPMHITPWPPAPTPSSASAASPARSTPTPPTPSPWPTSSAGPKSSEHDGWRLRPPGLTRVAPPG